MSPPARPLPFDDAARRALGRRLLEHVRASDEAPRVLDLDGGLGAPDAASEGERTAFALADATAAAATRLPFPDASFDVVTALDVLHRVAPARRADLVQECLRVSRGHVVLAGPWRDDGVAAARARVRSFATEVLGLAEPYDEALAPCELPSRTELEAWLERRGARVSTVAHGTLRAWLARTCLALHVAHDPALAALSGELDGLFPEDLELRPATTRAYRHALLVTVPGTRPHPGAPPTARDAVEDAAPPDASWSSALDALERERERWAAERARLEGYRHDLRVDVDSLREGLALLEQKLGRAREAPPSSEASASSMVERATLRRILQRFERWLGPRARD